MPSLDQERAAFAWKRVTAVKNGGGDFSAFTNLAKSAPALIMANGLMQTLAFLKQKSGEEPKKLGDGIAEWIYLRFGSEVKSSDFSDVMNALHGGTSSFYIQATEEALEVLRWIRQFAPALGKG